MYVGMLSLSASLNLTTRAEHSLRRHGYHLAYEKTLLNPFSGVESLAENVAQYVPVVSQLECNIVVANHCHLKRV